MPKQKKLHTTGRLSGPVLFVALLFCVLFAGGCGREEEDFFSLSEPSDVIESTQETEGPPPVTEQEPQRFCVVHICGAVKRPGVYELPEGSRVMDAVTAGGGFLTEADPASCNLAQPVTDGSRIYIMTEEESARTPYSDGGGGRDEGALSAAQGGRIDINTADAAALMTLPGIGESRAAAIIAFREKNGRYACIEDIMKVSGIKQAAFEKIRDLIFVE